MYGDMLRFFLTFPIPGITCIQLDTVVGILMIQVSVKNKC